MRKNRMSIRNFAKLKKAVLKKKNSVAPIAARRSILPMKNANTAIQDYKTVSRVIKCIKT